MEPIHSFNSIYLDVTNLIFIFIVSHELYTNIEGSSQVTLVIPFSKARLLQSCRFWPFSIFTSCSKGSWSSLQDQFHMASLFEERALLDLVRGLKTLRGGWKGRTDYVRQGQRERREFSQLIATMSYSVSKECGWSQFVFFLFSANSKIKTKTNNVLLCLCLNASCSEWTLDCTGQY